MLQNKFKMKNVKLIDNTLRIKISKEIDQWNS